MKKLILGLMIVVLGIGISGGETTHAWEDCNTYSGALKRQCEDDTEGRNFVEEITVNVADALRDVEEFNLRMQYYLRPYIEAELTFDQWKELYGYGSTGGGPIPGGEFRLPDAAVFGGIGANTDLRLFILNVLEWVLSFLGIVAIAVIIFAGYTYIVGGEENNEKAKKMILYAAIGIIVILSSYALVNTLITKTIEGGDNFETVQNYVSIEGIVKDIKIQALCGGTNCSTIYSLGSSGGFAIQPYDDIKFFITGGKEITNVQWNFGDGGLYESAGLDGAVTRSFAESKWYNVAVMGKIKKENPDSEDEDPYNRFVGQMRLWVGEVVLARFKMVPSVNPEMGQSVEFDASGATTITGAIDNYIWTCTPAAGVTPSPCKDFNIQRKASQNNSKHKKNFFATFDAPGAVTISLVVKAKIGTENADSQVAEEVINIQAAGGSGGKGGIVDFSTPNIVTVNLGTELQASGAPTDGSYGWKFADGTTDTGDKIVHAFAGVGVQTVELIAKDADGNQIGGVVTKNVIVSPRKGIINLVVPSIIVKDIPGELRASGAPTDGSYAWTFADGTTEKGDRILRSFAVEGVQSVELIAKDAVGNQIGGVVTKNVIISPENMGENPINFILPKVLLKNVPALLRATGAPTDGSYTWTFADGTTEVGDQIMHTFAADGIEAISLDAIDNQGTQIGGIVTKNAIVSSLAMPTAIATFEGNPVVSGIVIDFFRGLPGTPVFGTGSCDEFGDCGSTAQVTHSWKWNGASIPEAQLSQILTQLGTHVMTLVTTSTTDITKKGKQTFRIKVENNPPTVDFDIAEDPTLGPGFMRLNITADDIDGEITRYRLKATEYGNMLATQMIPTTQNTLSTIMDFSSEIGTHDVTFQVEVTDSDGGIGTTTKNEILTITPSTSSNQSPTVSIFTTPSTTGTTDSIFRFFTQAYDPDGDHLTYIWTFPGGQTVFGKTAVHRFDEAGEHVAKVTVTDGLENISDEEIITIVENLGGGGGSAPDALVKTSVEPVGANCANGGTRIEKGMDDNDNGFLDASEIDTTEYVCNGSGGSGGSAPDALVKTSEEPAGVNCVNGGTRIEKGEDDNDNGFLDASEVDTTEYACNGGGGGGGSDPDALVKTSVEPAGVNCENGGTRIEKGEDDNDNGFLDASEIDTTEYSCNGGGGGGGSDPDTLVKTSEEPAGVNCANGGTRIEKGMDYNDNGFLDASEVDTTEYACNGGGGGGGSDPDALVKTSVEPAGVNCANGGTRIEKGEDDNDNGFLDASEIDTTEYVCNGGGGGGGSDPDTLVKTSEEPAGVNCANGGTRIEKGEDYNDNGFLDASEVDTTEYACNGGSGGGISNPDTLVKTSEEPAGVNCANGGTRIEKGVDDNDNGFLDASEVDTTEYACNGGGSGGDSALDTLVKTGVEPAGVNCANGGTRIEKGVDDNDNGFLDASEVDTTEYACNGGNGGGDNDPSNNKAPQVQISGMSPGNTGDTTTQFSFFSYASDSDGNTLVYEWDFSDGSTSTMKNVIHRFAQPGTYQVRLRVSDGLASREVKISVRVVEEGEIIPESTLPLYVPEYHSSSLFDSTNTMGDVYGDSDGGKVLIVAGGKKDLKIFLTEVIDILNEKREALLHCPTEVECQKIQEQADLLELVAQKIALLKRETDPIRQKQLNDEITLLFAQIHEIDAEIDLNLAIIEGTINTMFFLYGQINFETDRPISIDWETGDGRRFAGQDVSWLYPNAGLYTVTMIVSDGTASVSDTLTIKVN